MLCSVKERGDTHEHKEINAEFRSNPSNAITHAVAPCKKPYQDAWGAGHLF